MTPLRRMLATVALSGAAASVALQPARAAQTTFNPELTLDWAYTDNVDYVEPTTSDVDTSDQNIRVGISLPVRRELKRGSISFAYDWGFTKYDSREEYDYGDHHFEFSYETRPGRLDTFRSTVGYLLTQNQGNSSDPSDDSADFFLSERSQRDAFLVELNYGRQSGPKWSWGATASAARFRFESIDDQPIPTPVTSLEARDTYRVDLDVGRALSRRVTVGASYGYQLSKLDQSGDERFQTLAFTIDRQFSENANLGLELGGYQRSVDEFADPGDEAFYDDSGIYANLIVDYGKEIGNVMLAFDAGVRPTAGGGLNGTSTNSTAAVSVSSVRTRSWNWSVNTRYTRRDPSDSREPSTATWAVGGSIERVISTLLGIRVGAEWADQSVGTGSISTTAAEGSFYSATVGLVYYPLGRTTLARGS